MARTVTVTVLFCDLVGSTERQTNLGDDAADPIRRRFFGALRTTTETHGGLEVKRLGDGTMVVFSESAADAVACALAMHEAVEELEPGDPAHLRIGISAGEVTEDEGDWFGTPVVEAARLCTAARSGQTLTTEVVRALVQSRRRFRLESVGQLSLKGLPVPVAAVQVARDRPLPAPSPSRPHRRRRRAVAATVIGACILIGIAAVVVATTRGGSSDIAVPAARGYTPQYATKPCPQDVRDKVPDAACGTLTVPENRAQPRGRRVKLEVRRAPARSDENSGDPTVDFGAEDLASSPVRDHSELIQISQRGWEGSDPKLTCPEYTDTAAAALTRPTRDSQTMTEGSAALRGCRARLVASGIDVDAYTDVDGGRDVLDLIRALHLERVNLTSGYIATIPALYVAHTAPGAVRSITLQDALPSGKSSSTDPTTYLAQAFDRYVALCQADTVCAQAFPNLPAAYEALWQHYRDTPTLVAGDDGANHRHEILIDGDRLPQAISSVLRNPETYPLLATGVVHADDSLIANRLIDNNLLALDRDAPWGAYFAGHCSYQRFTMDPGSELSKRTRPAFSGIDDGGLPWQCDAWGAKQSEFALRNVSTDVPTLLVYGGLATDISLDWIPDVRREFPRSTVITLQSLGPLLLSSTEPRCLADIRRTFVADPDARLDVATCERQSPLIRFVAE